MADYCHQCAMRFIGFDYGDLADLINVEDCAKGMGASVLCEGCGPTLVNHNGDCISADCLHAGKAWHRPRGGS